MPRDPNDVPTLVTNKFTIMTSKHNVRLVFGEVALQDGTVNCSQAAMMSHADARWLADLINAQILESETKGN